MHSTYFRNFAVTAVMVMVSFLLIGVAFGVVSRNVFLSETRENVQNSSQTISRMAQAVAEEGDLRSLEMRMMLSTIGSSTGQHIFICSTAGRVVACSDSAAFCGHIGTQLPESVLSALPETGSTTFRDTLGDFYTDRHYTVATVLVGDSDRPIGTLFVSRDTRDALNVWETILPLFLIISLAVLFLALIFASVSTHLMTKPLKNMAVTARRFGSGDLSARVETTGATDEIEELAEAFNSMADSLEKSEEKRLSLIHI